MLKYLSLAAWLTSLALVMSIASAGDDDDNKKKKKLDAETIFKKLDADNNGRLSKEEFLKIADRAKDAERAEKFKAFLTKIYEKLATDKQGITLDQFREGMKKAAEFREKKKKDQ